MSLHRPSWRAVAAVISAAALIAAGAGTIVQASGGQSARAKHTTVIKNTGKGPALSLTSKSKYPPLAVSNSKLVKKLNADLLDGLSAAQIAPTAQRSVMGTSGSTITGEQYFSSNAIPAGTYVASLNGLMLPDTGASYQCLMADYTKLVTSDVSGVWVLIRHADTDANINLDESNTITVTAGHTAIWGCAFSGTSMVYQPASFSLRPTTETTPLVGSPFSPRPAGRRALAQLP